jgi:ArsR family transcriptional regulator
MAITTTPQPQDTSLATADPTDEAVEVLRFLGDANRLRILRHLAGAECYVQELTDWLALPQPLVSYHLRRLRGLGLVRVQRRRQRVYYTLDPAAWAAFTRPLRDVCELIEFTPAAAASPQVIAP